MAFSLLEVIPPRCLRRLDTFFLERDVRRLDTFFLERDVRRLDTFFTILLYYI